MTQLEIIEGLKKLTTEERLEVIEVTLQALQKDFQRTQKLQEREERRQRLAASAELMLDDYLNDKELTALTVLDAEDFYD